MPDWPGKIEARGKFFFSGADKVFLKGVSYGPFAPDEQGSQFPDWDTHRSGPRARSPSSGPICLRTFTVPPRYVLDLAASRGVRVLVGIPWAEHVCFLDSKKVTRRHPAIGGGRGEGVREPSGGGGLHGRQRDSA